MMRDYCLRLSWLLRLWLLLVVSLFVLSATFAYDGPCQAIVAYGSSGQSAVGYDTVSVLATGEKENGTEAGRVPFAKFAEFLAAEEGLNGSLQLARGGSRSTVLAANRTLYDQFIESGGTLTRARSTAVFDAQGQQVFGRFFPESNEIMLYKGSNLGTLSEELIHFRDIQNSGLLYQKFNPNALLPSPYGGTWTLRDSLEAHAQTVLYQWGYVGKP